MVTFIKPATFFRLDEAHPAGKKRGIRFAVF